MKLSAVTNRGSRKDFIDLHYLITNFKSLHNYLELFREKYQQQDIGHVIRSLVFFEDAEQEPEVKTFVTVNWPELQKDFELWVQSISQPS
jgi:peptide methionine sulfoxide reductase MsrA